MQRWTCPQCKDKDVEFTTEQPILPVRCPCGFRDTLGAGFRDLSPEDIVELQAHEKPPLAARAVRYVTAAARWAVHGCPVRSDAEVTQILEARCRPCEFFAESTCMHRNCGCQVQTADEETETILGRFVSKALANKIRMATEHCPINRW